LNLVYQHFFATGSAETRRLPPEARPWMGLNAFWATVVKVELTDLVFAVDSILVGVAMSQHWWVVVTGGVLGIIMMRLVIGRLLSVVERYPPLVDAAFIVIAWVGAKLILEYSHDRRFIGWEVPRWASLAIIVAVFAIALMYARAQERSREVDDAARTLLEDRE
jgi:predicted tellurium resistance membrane protein TerC